MFNYIRQLWIMCTLNIWKHVDWDLLYDLIGNTINTMAWDMPEMLDHTCGYGFKGISLLITMYRVYRNPINLVVPDLPLPIDGTNYLMKSTIAGLSFDFHEYSQVIVPGFVFSSYGCYDYLHYYHWWRYRSPYHTPVVEYYWSD